MIRRFHTQATLQGDCSRWVITTKQVNTTIILKDLINKIKLKKNMSKPLDKHFQGDFVQGDAAM